MHDLMQPRARELPDYLPVCTEAMGNFRCPSSNLEELLEAPNLHA